jgi:hypothetical protein
MPPALLRYIFIETSISIVINVVLSALFVELVFGGMPLIGLWGAHGLAVDFIPQTFMISAMSVAVPTLLTRRRRRAGSVNSSSRGLIRVPGRSVWIRALLMGLTMTVLAGGLTMLALSAMWSAPAPFWQVFRWKLFYGAMVAMVVTPVALVVALSE